MARRKASLQEKPTQTLTVKAKIVGLSDQDTLLLGLLGFFATKLWNTANHHRHKAWKETGNIPGFAEQCRALKANRWYKLLPSQTAQEILGELDDSYRSWFAHRNNGNCQAKPPGFRKKDTLSAVTFKQKAFRILPDNRVMLRLPRTYSRREIILEYRLSPKDFLGEVKQVKLVFSSQTSNWYLHIVHRVSVKYREPGNIMALDLGIVNIAAGILSTGQTFLVPGKGLLALDRYFHKEVAKCRSSSSRRSRNLNRKWSRQRKHYLHALTRWIVDYAAGNNVSVIVVEELKGIRSDANWGDRGNQKLYAWPYRKIIRMLTYKAALKGIRVVDVSEKDTSITCPICRRRAKSARVMRGLFRHCGCLFNADMVGAYNILQRYLQEAGQPALGVVGGLARPAVNLFVWRKTTPQGREQGTFRQTA